jgi:hypothetical protein
MTNTQTFVTRKQLAIELKTTPQSIYRLESEGKIKSYKLTPESRPRYILSEVLESMGVGVGKEA